MLKERKVPMRMCSGCGERLPKAELVRVVRDSEGNIFLDRTGKKNGRGAYLCRKKDCLQRARKSRRIDRTLETQIPDAIYDRLEEEIGSDEA